MSLELRLPSFLFFLTVSTVSVGEGELSEAGVREAGRAEAVCDASRCRTAHHPRGREVTADVRVSVSDLI